MYGDPNVRVRASLLDCLCDPRLATGATGSSVIDIESLKEIIRADLIDLLSSRRYPESIPREFTGVASSILAYGIPDLTSFNIQVASQSEELRRAIQRTIEIFETRLSAVKVTLLAVNVPEMRVQYRVEGRVNVQSAPDCYFDAVFRSDLDRLEVRD